MWGSKLIGDCPGLTELLFLQQSSDEHLILSKVCFFQLVKNMSPCPLTPRGPRLGHIERLEWDSRWGRKAGSGGQ